MAAAQLQALSVVETELARISRQVGHHGLHPQIVILTSWVDLSRSNGRPLWLFSNQTSPARPGLPGSHRRPACEKLRFCRFPRSLSNQRLARLVGTKKYFGSHARHHPISGQQATEYLLMYTPHTTVDWVWSIEAETGEYFILIRKNCVEIQRV